MTAHELATILLAQPNKPVAVYGHCECYTMRREPVGVKSERGEIALILQERASAREETP